MQRHITTTRALATLIGALTFVLTPPPAAAQGCEPIRFTTPVSLGGEGTAYQPANEWQITLAYRRLVATEWFVGTEDKSSLAPGGQAPNIRVHTFVADVAYSINDRYRVSLSIPMSTGSISRVYADNAVHEQTAAGVGDVTLLGEAWLFTPRTHSSGNIAFSLGVKAPTGSHTVGSKFYTPTGSIDFPADQSIQPGDGGWGVLLQSRGFRRITDNIFAYVDGSYLVNPKARTDVHLSPTISTYFSVPDVYSARIGGAFPLFPDQGLTMSLGGRIDGIPVHDLWGGGDESTTKRTAYVIFADPGLALTRGRSTFTLSVPRRLYVNRMKSVLEQQTNALNGGGFAKVVVFAGYTRRF